VMEHFYAKADADAKAHRAFNRGMWFGAIGACALIFGVDILFLWF